VGHKGLHCEVRKSCTNGCIQSDEIYELPSDMKTFLLERELFIARPINEVFAFFGEPKNLESITPPWLRFRIRDASDDPLREGSHIRYRLKVHGFPMSWTSLISTWNPPYSFVDEQVSGPYRVWHHTHSFEEVEGGTLIRDRVEYAMFGGRLINQLFVRRDLNRVFDYRTERLAEIFGSPEPSIEAPVPATVGGAD
jgi:ligand-binding SRPBCC domain-containing protein